MKIRGSLTALAISQSLLVDGGLLQPEGALQRLLHLQHGDGMVMAWDEVWLIASKASTSSTSSETAVDLNALNLRGATFENASGP